MVSLKKVTAFIVVTFFSLALVLPVRAASEDLVKAANKEGSVVLYGGATLQHVTALIGNFNRTYPGIKVNYLRKSGTSSLN